MKLEKVKCAFCGNKFFRDRGRFNEAKKFSWNQYCSLECQYKDRTTRVTKKCGNPECHNKVSRLLNQFKRSKSGLIFCSSSCAIKIINSKTKLKSGKHQNSKKICPFCGKIFYGIKKYCSRKCYAGFLRSKPRIIRISKKQIIGEIKEFYKKNGRIPVKREFVHYCASRLRFRTWNEAVKAAGFKPNPVLFAYKHIAKDGHKCDSFTEKIIDDWLYEKGIDHEREISYPENPLLRVDFVTKNHWIEFFGLAGDLEEYDRLVKKKIAIAKKYRLSLLALYPKDLFPVNHLENFIRK